MPPQGQTQVPVSFVIVNGKRIPVSNSDPNASGGIPDFDPNEFVQDFDPNEFASPEQQAPQQNPYYQSPFNFPGPQQEQPTPEEQAPPPQSYYESPFAVKPFQFGDQRPQPEAPDPWYHPDRLIPMGLRAGGGVTGSILGGTAGSFVPGAGTIGGAALGGGMGSYLGDAAAQGYEYLRGDRPEGYNVKSGLVEGGLGAIPFMGKAPAMTAPARQWFRHAATAPIKGAAEGALLGAGGVTAHSLVEQGHLPTWEEFKSGGKGGAAFGFATAGALSSIPSFRRGRAAQTRATAAREATGYRNWNVGNILNDVEFPHVPISADMPPIRPEGTTELPVKKTTAAVAKPAYPPGSFVLVEGQPEVYEVVGPSLPGMTKLKEPNGRFMHSPNEKITLLKEPPKIDIPGAEPPEVPITKPTANHARHDELYGRIGEGIATPAEIAEAEALNRQLTQPETPELQFVDPNTGEMRTASEAQPGDIPLTGEQATEQQPQQRRATKTISSMELGPSPAGDLPVRPEGTTELPTPTTTETPDNFQDWMKKLISDESGTFDPAAGLSNALAAWRRRVGHPEPTAEAETPRQRVERYYAGFSRISREDRTFVENLPDDALQDFIARQSQNPNYVETTPGQNLLAHAQNTLDMRAAGELGAVRGSELIEPETGRPAEPYEMTQARRVHPDSIPQEFRDHIDSLDFDALGNYIDENRAAGRAGVARNVIEYARDRRDALMTEALSTPLNWDNMITPGTHDPISGEPYATSMPHPGFEEEAGAVQGQGHQLSEYEIAAQLEARRRTEKTLDELESGKRTPALERLGRLIGEDRAKRLVSGDVEINFNESARRPRGKRLSSHDIVGWGQWAKDEIDSLAKDLPDDGIDPSKPGIEVVKHNLDMFPNAFGVIWRNAEGVPMAFLKTDLAGEGISMLAAHPDLGLRRGRVAFDMLKEAFDRGIKEPSGSVSDNTRNLIERTKRLIARAAREESGEADFFALIENSKKLLDEFAKSGVAQKAKNLGKRFLKEESGTYDPAAAMARLRELFEKGKTGKLSNEEVTEARTLAAQVQSGGVPSSGNAAASAATGGAGGIPPSNIPPVITGGTGGNILPPGPPNAPGSMQPPPPQPPPGPEPRQPGSSYPQFGPTRAPIQGPELPGTGGLRSGRQFLEGNPQMEAGSGPTPNQAGAKPPQFGPTRKPKEGPRRPRVPFVDNNPQLVQDLQARIRTALEQQNPNVGPGDINKLMASFEQVVRQNPNMDTSGIIRQVLGANKALLTSWDLSAPGRQGKAFLFNSEFWKALPGMVKAWGNKGAADVIQKTIEDHPSGYFKQGINPNGKPTKSFAELAGLELSAHEEMFSKVGGQTFEKYSGIGKSSRAHTAFLNKLRSDMFAKFMEQAKAAGRNPEVDLELAKTFATYINNATGRGSVNVGKWKLERMTGVMNDVFFAPKNLSGQIRTWNQVLNPVKYATMDPVLRKQSLKSLFAIAGAGMMTAEISRELGAKVSHDPTSTDFMKIKVGDTRIDLFGGYQQFPVAAMTALLGQKTMTAGRNAGRTVDLTAGRFGQPTRKSEAEKFFKNRLSPVGSFIYSWMDGREFDGKPFEVKRALYERAMPIVMKDIMELAQEDPAMAAVLSPLLVSGVASTQVYSGR